MSKRADEAHMAEALRSIANRADLSNYERTGLLLAMGQLRITPP